MSYRDVIYSEGDVPKYLYFIKQGKVEVNVTFSSNNIFKISTTKNITTIIQER